MILQDCYSKYYTINYFNDHIEIEINFIPKIILIMQKYISI